MAGARLTKILVEAAQAGPADRYIWDPGLSGFGVKITPAGSRVYLIQYRPKGGGSTDGPRPVRRYTIGRHGAPWTTDAARAAAADLLARVRLGEDPFLADKAAREQERIAAAEAAALNAHPFDEVVKEFIAKYARPKNKSFRETERILASRDVAQWTGRGIATITRRDVVQVIDAAAKRSHGAARLLFAQLRKMFNWCVQRDYIELSPCQGMSGPSLAKARDRWLSDQELGWVWRASDGLSWPFGPMIKLLILTGQRREEVCGMDWSEVDLAQSEWTIPARRAKNGRAHVIDLSPAAIEVFLACPGRSGLVFTTTGDTPVSGHARAKARLDKLITALRSDEAAETGGVEPLSPMTPWRVHDLRRTAATGMSRLGHPPYVVEAVLNHLSGVRGGLIAVYQHYEHRPERKAALLAWAAHVMTAVDLHREHQTKSAA